MVDDARYPGSVMHVHRISPGGISAVGAGIREDQTATSWVLTVLYSVTLFMSITMHSENQRPLPVLRVIYAYYEEEDWIEFVEIYYKGDKASEDRVRIVRIYGKSRQGGGPLASRKVLRESLRAKEKTLSEVVIASRKQERY